MEFTVQEVLPKICSNRTEMGRVVINPPHVMGPLGRKPTAKFFMCCNRAFLTEDSYQIHYRDKKVHDEKPIDFRKLPAPNILRKTNDDTQNNDPMSNVNLLVKKEDGTNKSKVDHLNTLQIKVETTKTIRETSVRTSLGKEKGFKTCPICHLRLPYSNSNRHMTNSHVPDGIKCNFCPCTFLFNRSLVRHERKVHGFQKCNASSNKFRKAIVARAKQVVSSNVVKQNGRKVYTCPTCGKDFPGATRLRDHMNIHSGSRPYKCEICGFRFSHLSNLGRHQRKSHTKDDKIFCTICNCGFANNSLFSRHNKSIHPHKLKIKSPKPNSPKLVTSDGLKSSSPAASPKKKILVPDLQIQHPPQNSAGLYECHVCQKSLSTPQTWRNHMLIHQNLKPHKCKHCGRYFRLCSTRALHISVCHSGGRFKCNQCTCSFKASNTLHTHIKKCHSKLTHGKTNLMTSKVKANKKNNAESPKSDENVAGFKCNLCGRVVKTLTDFNAHKALHNSNKSSQCNLCLKDFSNSSNVKFHKMRAHGDTASHNHKCPFCCCRYTASPSLFKHLVNEHKMDRDDWNFKDKSIKPEARRRIHLRLCDVESNQEIVAASNLVDENTQFSEDGESEQIVEKPSRGIKQDTSGIYECDICHQRFKLFKQISQHKKIAHNQGSFVCGLCPCRYNNLTWLKKHQVKVHGSSKTSDGINQTTRRSSIPKDLLQESTQSSSSSSSIEKTVECNICKHKVKSLKTLAVHKQASHFHSGKFKCDKCPCKFIALKGLERHLSLYHRHLGRQKLKATENVNGLNDKNMELKNKFHLTSNNEIIGDEDSFMKMNQFECELCHIKFKTRNTLKAHKRTSHDHSGKFKCSMCTCKFLTPGGLINHKKFHHSHKKTLKDLVKAKRDKAKGAANGSISILSPLKANDQKNIRGKLTESVTTKIPGSGRIECEHCHLKIFKSQMTFHKKTSHASGTIPCPDCTCLFVTTQGLVRHRVFYHSFRGNSRRIINKLVHPSVGSTITPLEERTSPISKVNRNFLKIRSSTSTNRTKSKHSPTPVVNSPTIKGNKSETQQASSNASIEFYPSKPPRPASSTTNYRFKCDLCGIKFSHTAFLKRHQNKAHINGGSSCDLCPCTFTNLFALAAHKRVYHSPSLGGGVQTIKPVNRPVKTRLNFEEKKIANGVDHIKKSSGKRDSDSNGTSTVLSNSAIDGNLVPANAKRRRIATSKVDIINGPSNKLEQNESTLEKSNSLQVPSNPCTFCAKTFTTTKLLEKHILSHTRPEHCPQCTMKFRTKEEVAKHINTAHDERSMHQCYMCSCRFATLIGLKTHQGNVHKYQSNNIVIEHEDGTPSGDEPFLQVSSTYSQQNIDVDAVGEESEPIVQGILETSYCPNGNAAYVDEERYQGVMDRTASEIHDEGIVYEEPDVNISEVLDFGEPEVAYDEESPANVVPIEKKSSFSPKSRPIKCGICGIMVHGPEKLRLHNMESHYEEHCDNEPMLVDSTNRDSIQRCEKCSNEFVTNYEFSQHMQLEHDESGLYRCAYCPCTMKTETNLRYHFTKYHSG